MKFTRRHARALATGAAATAAYLAGAKCPTRGPYAAGRCSCSAPSPPSARRHASATAKTTAKRMDAHVAATAGAVHLNNIHGTALNSLATNSAVLLTLAGAIDPTFLAGMVGPMGHQTTANNTIVNGNGNLSGADATAINGLVNAVNTLQSHLQTANIES